MNHSISIVTVTYNSARVIDDFINSLLKQRYKAWHVYIIDSNSTDNTLDLLAKYTDERITLIPQKLNIGFAGGSNIGINYALQDGCDHIMLINNDVEFEEQFLEILSEEISIKNADIVAPKMMYFNPPDKIWCAGGGFLRANAWASYHKGINKVDSGQYDTDEYCDFVPLCCALMKKSCFEVVGLLDEKYFIYSEDSDWFYRSKKAGLKLMYCYKPVLYHKVSSLTGGLNSKFAVQVGTRNRIYFIRKHFTGVKRYHYISKYFIGMFYSVARGKYSVRQFFWRLPAFFRGLIY